MTHGLVASAARLGPAFDLLAAYSAIDGFFFERRGLGVAGSGIAFRRTERADRDGISSLANGVIDALKGVARSDEGPGPVAVGTVPFDADGDAQLVIPFLLVRHTSEGDPWRIGVAPEGEEVTDRIYDRPHGIVPHAAFGQAQLRPVPEPAEYTKNVARAVERIRGGELRKVVLARTLLVESGRKLDARGLVWRLRAVEPNAYAFGALDQHGIVMAGASPELLVSRRGREVRANPLAGSAARSGDPDEDRANAEGLAASVKDRDEHNLVVDAIQTALAPLCEKLEHDAEPVLHATANVWHLSTRFRGALHQPAPSALELVGVLHPTPAVCGTPPEQARRLIAELEGFERRAYGGAVGWVDADGDGVWAIALRCAELHDWGARLFAGAGIVAASEPEAELEETERKFRAFLDSLRWS